MDALESIAGGKGPEVYAMTAAMALEHLGNLFGFLDQRLGELVIFDPAAKIEENTIREALKVGTKVCAMLVKDGPKHGADPAVMRAVWEALVQEAVLRDAS